MEFVIDRVESPIGTVSIVSDGANVRALDFDDYEDRMHELLRRQYGEVSLQPGTNPAGASDAVRRYFDGDIHALDSVSAVSAGTPFQQLVWSTLRQIPVGTTWSYGQLAHAIGKPSAPRAVGLANGSNPIAVIVPCHRVIGADGSLTGYGGGLHRKEWLLAHEGVGSSSFDFD